MTWQSDIAEVGAVFGSIPEVPVYHYWRFGQTAPWGVWEETARPVFDADGSTVETAGLEGYVHLFTKRDADPLADVITAAMDAAGMTWGFEFSQYEENAKLIHIEWRWAWARS